MKWPSNAVEELVAAARRGDADAFAVLVQRFQDMAVAYALSILGNYHDAEDAAQAAFLDAHRNLGRLETPAAFGAWLRRIVFKQCDRLRRRKKLPTENPDAADAMAASRRGPDEIAERREELRTVLQAMAAPSDDEREVVALYYGRQHDHKEIAAFLDVPVTTVNNRLASARRRLKERMLQMVAENLEANRPSRDEAFAQRAATILKAAAAGDAATVRKLLGEDAELASATDTYAKTALHYAAEHNRPEIAEILLAAGADVQALTSWGMTPLEWAANMGRTEVAEKLLAAGATLNLWSAAGLGKLAGVQAFFAADGSLKPDAGHRRPKEVAPGMWKSDPPAEDARPIISDAFCIACRNGHMQVAEFLLNKRADINFRGFFGGPGLHWACTNGHRETVVFLLDHGADPLLRDTRFGSTAIGWAAEGEHDDVINLLLSRGLTMDHWQMAQIGRVDLLQAALDAQPELLETVSGYGTALHEAALWGRADAVRFLLQRGANPQARNREGQTALEIVNRAMQGLTRPANRPGHAAVAELLRRHTP